MCTQDFFFFLCKHRSNGALLWQWNLKPNSWHAQYVFAFKCSNFLFLCMLLIFVNAKEKMCRPATWIEVEDRNKNTHAHMHACTGNERKRRDKGEGALLHLWICHFAITVSVTFAKVRNKMCVWACVFMCIGCAWLWVCTVCAVCALTYSDQISIIVCSRCYRVWDHACFLLPSFPPVRPPLSHGLCSSLNWLKMTR